MTDISQPYRLQTRTLMLNSYLKSHTENSGTRSPMSRTLVSGVPCQASQYTKDFGAKSPILSILVPGVPH